MQALLDQALFAPTLPFTIALAALVLYWLLVAFGVLSAETDAGEADLEGAPDGAWGAFLGFLNVGEVPLMIVLTVLTLTTWVLSMCAGHFVAGGSALVGFALLAPALGVACVVTHYATMPFKRVLRLLGSTGDAPLALVGRTCTITTSRADATHGQAEVQTAGAPVLIAVRTTDGATLNRGDAALIVSEDAAKGTFTIRKVTADTL